MLDRLTHTDFEQQLESTFVIHYAEKDSFDARLISVKTIGHKPENPDRRWSFSLIFHIPYKEQYLIQRMYPVSHPVMGQLDLFLVPLGPDETGMRYEAIFT